MEQNYSSINVNYSAQDDAWRLLDNYLEKQAFADSVYIWIISVIEIPLMLLTLFALCFLIKSRHAASVYVTHLILSDLVQVICVIISTTYSWPSMLLNAHLYSLIVGLYFMACIAFERYFLVSHPIWYRSHHSVKFSCLISVIVWFVPLIFATIDDNSGLYFEDLYLAIACFIPYPIIILCFVGTRRGLSHSISLTSQKRKFILGSLFLVLLNYTFIILPYSIMSVYRHINKDFVPWDLTLVKFYLFLFLLLYLNPLVDCILYLFMRSDAGDIMKSFQCCCRSDTHQNSVRYTTTTNSQHHNV